MRVKIAVILGLILALSAPLAAQEAWLGAGGLVMPGHGNAAYSTAHQEAQLSAGFFMPVGERFSLNFGLATDTVKAQRWLVEHNFSDGPVAEWSRRYYALDLEAHYCLTPGSKLLVTAFAGPTVYRSGGFTWGGARTGVLGRYGFGPHLTLALELSARHSGAGPYGDYTVGEAAVRLGWRF